MRVNNECLLLLSCAHLAAGASTGVLFVVACLQNKFACVPIAHVRHGLLTCVCLCVCSQTRVSCAHCTVSHSPDALHTHPHIADLSTNLRCRIGRPRPSERPPRRRLGTDPPARASLPSMRLMSHSHAFVSSSLRGVLSCTLLILRVAEGQVMLSRLNSLAAERANHVVISGGLIPSPSPVHTAHCCSSICGAVNMSVATRELSSLAVLHTLPLTLSPPPPPLSPPSLFSTGPGLRWRANTLTELSPLSTPHALALTQSPPLPYSSLPLFLHRAKSRLASKRSGPRRTSLRRP